MRTVANRFHTKTGPAPRSGSRSRLSNNVKTAYLGGIAQRVKRLHENYSPRITVASTSARSIAAVTSSIGAMPSILVSWRRPA